MKNALGSCALAVGLGIVLATPSAAQRPEIVRRSASPAIPLFVDGRPETLFSGSHIVRSARSRATGVDTVVARPRSHAVGWGAIAGGASGAILGLIGGSMLETGCPVTSSTCSVRDKRIGFMVSFAAEGAVAGAAVGALVGKTVALVEAP